MNNNFKIKIPIRIECYSFLVYKEVYNNNGMIILIIKIREN